MKANELKELLKQGALSKYPELYGDINAETQRFIKAIDAFCSLYGEERDMEVFSVPGRSEILGNHTDHNQGLVLAGAIDRDIIAIAARNEDGVIRFTSEGFGQITVDLGQIDDPESFENYTSEALVAGLAKGIKNLGGKIGGYDAYSVTEVLKGSGISSSAAFEVMIGNIFNYLYNDGKIENQEIAKLSQFAENVYFGKPCGLMDQMACAVGGFVFIDFEKKDAPKVEPIDFSLSEAGYSLCIINTGGNHADLNDDYASIPREMKAVAAHFGKEYLRGITGEEIIAEIPALRATLGDRAILRALHFVCENERVIEAAGALRANDTQAFLLGILQSGQSSFNYLQNVYTTKNVGEQGLSLALCLAENYLKDKGCAYRVHGGGFAGTVQTFVKNELASDFCAYMDKAFGEGSAMCLRIRPTGACKLF